MKAVWRVLQTGAEYAPLPPVCMRISHSPFEVCEYFTTGEARDLAAKLLWTADRADEDREARAGFLASSKKGARRP